MNFLATLKDKRQERKNVADAAGAILTKAHNEKRRVTGEENTEWEKRMADVDAIQKEIEQLEKQHDLETRLAQPAEDRRSAGREDYKPEPEEQRSVPAARVNAPFDPKSYDKSKDEYRSAFVQWMADPGMLNQKQARMLAEKRALAEGTGTAGGYTVPQGFQYELDVALKSFGGIMETAEMIETTMGNILPWPSMNDTGNTAEQISENAAATIANGNSTTPGDPVYGVVNFSAYMHDSGIIQVPIDLLQDSAFNIEKYITDACMIRLGRKINTNGTVGTGSNAPTGIVTAVNAGTTSTLTTASSATGLVYNDLLNLEHSVDPAYRNQGGKKAKWMFADLTLKAIKKLTDNNGRPLFLAGGVAEGINAPAPDQIDGYDYVINQDMPQIGASNTSVLFGDLTKFKVRLVRQAQMTRFNERFMTNLQIGFLVWRRLDSNLIDAGMHPVKGLQHPSS